MKAEISGRIGRRELAEMPGPPDADLWELTLNVPTGRLEDLIESLEDEELRAAVLDLSNQDKANIVQIALQHRMDGPTEVPPTTDGEENG